MKDFPCAYITERVALIQKVKKLEALLYTLETPLQSQENTNEAYELANEIARILQTKYGADSTTLDHPQPYPKGE